MNKKLLFFSLLLSFVIHLNINAQVEVVYDFNSLEIANLDGQDDWKTILHTAGPHDIFIDIAGGNVVSPDGTQAAYYNGSGAGYGRTATRKASDNFDFDFTNGGVVEVEIDLHRSYWGMFFGLGFDADGDGHIAPGIDTEVDDGGFYFNIAAQNPDNNKIVLPNGESVIFTAENEGWCRYKLVFDFNANDGEGAIALSYKNIEDGGEWIAISEVQGINMGMTPGSGDKQDYEVWDGIFLHSTGGTGGFDNILIRQPENTGELQFIEFASIPDKLTTDPSFDLVATSTSGLLVDFEVTEGPATVSGNLVSLTGEAGFVTIKASQSGDDTFGPAPSVYNTFEVVDPTAFPPDLTIRRPANGTKAYMSELDAILLVASAYTDHEDVLNVQNVVFQINGETLTAKDWQTGYYTTTWTPPAFGDYSLTVVATSSEGQTTTQDVSFEVSSNITDIDVATFDQTIISPSQNTVTDNFVFPTFAGAFDNIISYLSLTTPPGGFDIWDRVGYMEARAPSGEWIEIFRYITPYNVECDHNLDVTDYASIFQGLVEMRFNIGAYQNGGYMVDVDFDFTAGEPEYKYSWVDAIWHATYPFGDYENMQPVDTITYNFPPETLDSKLKINNTGHGWGDLNTGNASEFYDATHKIKVNDQSYDQHLWVICNPNPDGCQPQEGTWFHNRAGWCPGSIGKVYDFELTEFVNQSDVSIIYEFYPEYVDLCHPNHPDCVTGVTCADCESGFNPHYVVAGNLVMYSNSLIDAVNISEETAIDQGINIFPNPCIGTFTLSAQKPSSSSMVFIYDLSGKQLKTLQWDGSPQLFDVKDLNKGVYLLSVPIENEIITKRLLIY